MEPAAAEGAVATTVMIFRDGVILLGASLLFVTIYRRLGLGAVLGYLTAGALVGPHGFALVGEAENLLEIADIGIALLLFLVGLELTPNRLWRLRRDIFGLGVLQVAVSGLAIAVVVYFATGFTPAAALALGLPLALSSTAQVLPSLRSDGEINTPAGERAFSILLFQDLSIVPLLTIVAALSRAPADPSTPPGWVLTLSTLAAIIGLVLAGRFVVRPLFRVVARVSERELFVIAALFTVLASAAVMEALHLSTALGAFVAGVMLADTPYRHELELDVEPFRSLLLGLFFVAVGMMLDLGGIAARPLFVIGMAAALILLKAVILFGLAKWFGMETPRAIRLGLLLSQGGEFAFVLFGQAQAAMLIEPQAASLFSAIVTLSMATTQFLLMFNDWFERWGAKKVANTLDGPELSGESSAILVGYGRFGQTVGQMLMAKGVAVTLIDDNPNQIEVSDSFGMKVYYGDGKRVDLLRQAGADTARALLFCMDGQFTPQKLKPIMEAFPQAAVFVRVYDRRQVMELGGLELAGVYRELFESAVQMGRDALRVFDVDEQEVESIEREYRDRDDRRLRLQSSSGDLHALEELMFRPDRPFTGTAPEGGTGCG